MAKKTEPVHSKGPADTDSLENRLLTGLSRVGAALRSEAWGASSKEGLNPTQLQALTFLGAQADPLTLTELALKIGVTKASLSDSVSNLEKKGFVRKKPSETDQRLIGIELTNSGKKIAAKFRAWPQDIIEGLGHLNEDDKAQFLNLISKLILGLQDQGKISANRMCVSCKFFKPNAHPGSKKPHHCALVDSPIEDAELRLDCPEHEVKASGT